MRRIALFYLVVLAVVAAGVAISVALGSDQEAQPSIAGGYLLSAPSECLGEELELSQSGQFVNLKNEAETLSGELRFRDPDLEGDVRCLGGERVPLAAGVEGELIRGEAGGERFEARFESPPPEPGEAPAGEEPEEREFGETVALFFAAVTVIMIVARLFGSLATRLGQPRVMGEVVAGIALGPTVLGALLPEVKDELFPTDIVPVIGIVANLGLIFYMFLIGLELDPRQLRGRVTQAAAISNASVALPMVLGIAAAVPLFGLLAPATDFVAFALFMGVAMSITAFPVLARILSERRMLKRPLGAIAMASAAVDDVSAWFLIALATAVAVAGTALDVLGTVGLAIAFCLVMFGAVRPVLARMAGAYEEAGRVPGGWVAAIFAGVLLSAYVTETIGVALIFGAFIMGLAMPRHAGLTEDVTRRIEDFVVTLLLPLFFAFTGLRTDMGLLDRPELWLITLGLLGIAILAKFGGAAAAARVTGFGWRGSAVVGTLMNTRGLTELIVLNLALEKGAISEALFAALVIMALVTTFMTGPLLRLLDPRNEFGAPVEEELEEALRISRRDFPELAVPERAILVAPQSPDATEHLLAIAALLARSEPPRELIVAELVPPPRAVAAGARVGLQTEDRLLREASRDTHRVRDELVESGIPTRAAAFISTDAGRDLSEIAAHEEVDLLLLDGRRPLVGEAVPRGAVGAVLAEAPCDVAVLVTRQEQEPALGEGARVLVPFGAAEHDWAALELGAWVCSASGAQLTLLGAAAGDEEREGLRRRLDDAALLVRQYSGVVAGVEVTDPGRGAIVSAAAGATLLVVGLSERWRREGLGPTRSHIASAVAAPVLFVRRGLRPGALAPSGDVTRFTWSSPGME